MALLRISIAFSPATKKKTVNESKLKHLTKGTRRSFVDRCRIDLLCFAERNVA